MAQYFVAKANRDANQNIRYISREALEYLSRLTWTGNVRQLENVITHAVIMNAGERLTEKTFMSVIRREDTERSLDDPAPPSAPPREYTPKSLAEMEHEQIQQALAYTHWHKGRACEILGITRPRLERKIRKFGIKPSHYYLEGH
ncbi:MAG: hypothetical protein HY804_03875 [Nitrospinae bacterium]|nr:hypothetical protein [Nitrospinota bacterium]